MTVSVGPALAGDDASQVALSGDVTQDGKLDGEDVRAMLRAWGVDTAAMAATEQHRLGDLNLDGVVGEDDWSALNAAWRQEHGMILDLAFAQAATAGDYDRSGVVDQLDHGVWKSAFGDKAGAEWPIADGNLDGVVDAADYGVWRDNVGASVAYDTIANAVGAADAEAAREELLDGVTDLAITGAPGKIAVFDPPGAGPGEGAFSVMHDGDYRPIVAASFWGNGRVVAFGHNGYTEFSSVGDQLDTGRLYLNSVRWAAAATGESQAIVTSSTGTRDWLASRGFTNVTAYADWENYLDGADLLITELGPNVSAAKQAAVGGFIEAGGGLITGGTGWGYKSLGYDLQTLDGNQVLRQAGLSWTDGFRNGTTNATRRSTALANATAALDFAETLWAGSAGTQAQREEAGEALLAALEVLPADHELAVEIAAAFTDRADTIAPTPASPIADSLDKAVVTWASNHLLNTPVDQVSAHSTAAELYGAVPDTAPRVTETVTLDTSKSGWLATGLYVAPGEVVTVTAPASLVGRGYKLRINAHTDDISQRSSWERMPVVHRTFGVETVEVQVASAFGGLLFLDTGSSPAGLGVVDITVAGAVRAPFFVLGQHSDDQWSTTLRNGQAPYGVLVSDNLMIVLPKHQIEQANLTEPTALMTWWNETVAMQDELAAQEEFRTRPEIINVDIQNSAGAAHSGYPIQAYQRHWGNLADWQTLRLEGSWGDFHELGHNHQRGWWTFDGDGEVTVNIFSNYNLEQQASDPLGGWAYSADPVATIQRAMQDVVPGGSYSSKSDRWSFWFQLADGFGWDAYRNVFAGYEADAAASPNRLPVSNEQEKDQWLVRWSNEVGYDMTRFMVDTWGLSVSQAAIDSVSGLPDWMPLATTAADFQIELGQSRTLNLSNAGIGMDGVAEFVGVTAEPRLGTLTAGRNGGHLYEPQVGSGVDSLEVTYRSSAGNTQAFVISIVIGDGKVAGDANQDGTLDMQDVAIFSTNWRGDTRGLDDAGRHASGDFNLDGTINFADWAILYQAWQDQHQQSLSLSTVLQVGADPASVELTASAGNESAAAEFVLPERKWAVAWSSFRSEPDRE